MTPKGGKSTDHVHNLISSECAQDTSTCKISDHSLHAFSGKCPETSPDGRTDGHAAKRSRLVGWTNGPMYKWKEVISGFGRTDGQTDGRTDGQPENIMPPAPKGGGIKCLGMLFVLYSQAKSIGRICSVVQQYYGFPIIVPTYLWSGSPWAPHLHATGNTFI